MYLFYCILNLLNHKNRKMRFLSFYQNFGQCEVLEGSGEKEVFCFWLKLPPCIIRKLYNFGTVDSKIIQSVPIEIVHFLTFERTDKHFEAISCLTLYIWETFVHYVLGHNKLNQLRL